MGRSRWVQRWLGGVAVALLTAFAGTPPPPDATASPAAVPSPESAAGAAGPAGAAVTGSVPGAADPAGAASGGPPPGAADPAALARLAADPTWLRLLHARDGRHGEVVSEGFYLAAGGAADPAAELAATLAALATPLSDAPDAHPRCRFPARAFWLHRQGALPGWRPEPRCQQFERWALLPQLRGVSLLLVSGYFGNPASTFGHALLKLDTGAGGSELLDLAFNFGALVPENEPTPVYVWRGLTGGYQAGFSDKFFYTQDAVYTRTEFRDMWAYDLGLTEDQRLLLVFHLWEVVGRKFTYWFLTQNCAFRMAELLELVTGHPFVDGVRGWYSPVELFHRLRALDAGPLPGLVARVRYLPSAQRTAFHAFEALAPEEVEAANGAIADGLASLPGRLAPLPPPRRTEVVDALLAWAQYRVTAEQPQPSPALLDARVRLLGERLRLPPAEGPPRAPPPRPSPAEQPAPMLAAAGAGVDGAGRGVALLRYAPYSTDLLSRDATDHDEMVAMGATAGVDERGRAFLDGLDVIRVRRLATTRVSVGGERQRSWLVHLGARRVVEDGRPRTEAFLTGGLGQAARLGAGAVAYALVEADLATGPDVLTLTPTVGLVAGAGAWKGWLRGGVACSAGRRTFGGRAGLDLRYALSQHRALRLGAELRGEVVEGRLAFHQAW